MEKLKKMYKNVGAMLGNIKKNRTLNTNDLKRGEQPVNESYMDAFCRREMGYPEQTEIPPRPKETPPKNIDLSETKMVEAPTQGRVSEMVHEFEKGIHKKETPRKPINLGEKPTVKKPIEFEDVMREAMKAREKMEKYKGPGR